MRLVPRLLIPLAMGLLALSAGCASHSGSGSSGYPEESWYAQRQRAAQEARFRRSYEAVFDESAEEGGPRQAKAVQVARSAIGTPYVPGGRNPGGFDCSGLVQWAYKSVGINLPRTAREQSAVGKRITRVEDMRAGDIVAFHHPRRGYHTGIYVGDGKFVHSPRRWTRVRINSLDDPYFRTTFMGARRVEGSDAFSAEELRMAAYAEEQAVREISHHPDELRQIIHEHELERRHAAEAFYEERRRLRAEGRRLSSADWLAEAHDVRHDVRRRMHDSARHMERIAHPDARDTGDPRDNDERR